MWCWALIENLYAATLQPERLQLHTFPTTTLRLHKKEQLIVNPGKIFSPMKPNMLFLKYLIFAIYCITVHYIYYFTQGFIHDR